MEADLPRFRSFKRLAYSYCYLDPEMIGGFGSWLVSQEWREVFRAEGSNTKAQAYERAIMGGVAMHFPLKTTRRKDTDPPWLNDTVRRKIRRRKAIYRREGRSVAWKCLKKATLQLLQRRMRVYQDSQRLVLLADDGDRSFFKNVKAYMTKEKPRPFSVSTLFPGKQDSEVAEVLADHFNAISREFLPLEPSEPSDISPEHPQAGKT